MRVLIEIDAGERQATFIREPLYVTISDNPSDVMLDQLVGAFGEAREWLERGTPPMEATDEQ
jgi:hypothetical protein